MTDVVQQISELFRTQNTFLVLTHYRPDGDAVGSQLALLLVRVKSLSIIRLDWSNELKP